MASGDVNLAEFLGVGAVLVASVAFSKSVGRKCCRAERGLARMGRRTVLGIALAAWAPICASRCCSHIRRPSLESSMGTAISF
jgi:hypothetical protein